MARIIATTEEWQRKHQVAGEAFRLIFPKQPTQALPLETFLPSPLNIPECKHGNISIGHRMLTGSTPIIGLRQAITRDAQPTKLDLGDSTLRVHELKDKRAGVWMTDLPEELHQIAIMINMVKPRGRVLVGGLGLGLVAHRLAKIPRVKEVVVVERSKSVIKLISPHLPKERVKVVNDNIAHYLQTHRSGFDFYLLDTWQGTSESTWWSEVMPLKRIIRNRWGDKPVINCWAEDIMAGQILPTLAGKERHWHHEKLPPGLTAKQAAYFFESVGAPAWESNYGELIKRGRGQ